MAVLTLADYAASPKPLVAGVAQVLRKASPLMDIIPFTEANSLKVQVIRTAGRPSISWRKIGEDHGSAKGQVDVVEEAAFSLGNYIDVDKVYVKAGNLLYDPRALWTQQTLEAVAHEFNDAFINGDPTVDEDRPTGLWYRLLNDLPAAQSINGASLDISPDTADTSAQYKLVDVMDQLIYQLPDQKADVIVANDTFLLRMWSMWRKSGYLTTSKDALGREFYEYKGARIIDAGFKGDDTTKIIGNVENVNGQVLTGGTATSVYAFRLGNEYLTGWQQYALDVLDKGLLEDGLTYRTIVDWMIGLAISNPRSAARVYGLIAA